MELDETIEEFHTRLPEEALQCNAATLLEIDEEIATSGDKLTDANILAFIREEFTSVEEEEDDIEAEGEPLDCIASFQVDRAVKTLQQFALFCDNGIEIREMVEKIGIMAKREYSAPKK